ncbi:TetR/AcrR family transcriptional regulator [Kaarinaea lacus]
MAGPTKQFDQNAALKKALEVFWDKGYEAASMQDLVVHMGVNRASMYDTFGNKYELFKQALGAYCQQSLVNIKQVLEAPGSPLQNILHYFQLLGSSEGIVKHHGCFINNTAVEMGPHKPEIADHIRQHWSEVEAVFQSTLDRGVEQGELRADTDTASLARLFNTLIQGLAVSSKVQVSPEYLASVVKTVFTMIKAAQVR